MNKIRNFFWVCSGADLTTLKRTPTESNKYIGIGGTIFFTAVLAFLSSAYAIYTVFDSYLASFIFGLIWALMIFNLDRYIVSSMKNKNNFWGDFFVATPRLVIAIFLAIVISKPLELKIFEKEINAELVTMEQEMFKVQEDELKKRFTFDKIQQQTSIDNLKTEIDEKTAFKDVLVLEALKEADGTGGSGIRNMGPIYKAKKIEADKAEAAFKTQQDILKNQIETHTEILSTLTKKENQALAELKQQPYNGFAARIEALGRLTDKSKAMALANLFIFLLFIVIETAPIMVKLISYRGPYDFKLDAHEHAFAMQHKQRTGEQFENMKNNVKFHTETGSYRLRAEIEAEKEIIDYKIKEKLGRLKIEESVTVIE